MRHKNASVAIRLGEAKESAQSGPGRGGAGQSGAGLDAVGYPPSVAVEAEVA